jgi:hypothetical protein
MLLREASIGCSLTIRDLKVVFLRGSAGSEVVLPMTAGAQGHDWVMYCIVRRANLDGRHKRKSSYDRVMAGRTLLSVASQEAARL